MTNFPYEKWEATGNDFVIVDLASVSQNRESFSPEQVSRLCNREQGVGADGVVLLDLSTEVSTMSIINSDGSPSGMCGNALRCVAQILHRQLGEGSHRIAIGDRVVECQVDPHGVATVVMGSAEGVGAFELFSTAEEFQKFVGKSHLVWFGNPHLVVPVSAIPGDWSAKGDELQEVADRVLGMGGINVGFLEQTPGSDDSFALRVFERGAGVTQSCGSGACAASAVLETVFQVSPPHRLGLLGGVLTVGRSPDGFTLSGPATQEFEGEWTNS